MLLVWRQHFKNPYSNVAYILSFSIHWKWRNNWQFSVLYFLNLSALSSMKSITFQYAFSKLLDNKSFQHVHFIHKSIFVG